MDTKDIIPQNRLVLIKRVNLTTLESRGWNVMSELRLIDINILSGQVSLGKICS